MSVWDALVGQQAAVLPLQTAVSDPTAMTHAWLITGPPGSGRSVAARSFAAALQCPQQGCGLCQACQTVLAGSHPDITVMATDNVTISIGDVRGLAATAARRPSLGAWRVIIIEDADRMTERTANVLLKAVEEPPEQTVWVLAAPSPRDVIVTIRSRCRAVALRIPSVAAVTELLIKQDSIASDQARLAALAAQCHIGVARRLATDPTARQRRDQVLALPRQAGSTGGAVIAAGELVETARAEAEERAKIREENDAQTVRQAYGLADGDPIPAALRSQLNQFKADKDEVKRRITRWQRDTLDRAIIDLLAFYRDVLSVQQRSGVDLINASHAEEVMRLAETTSPPATLRCVAVINQARQRLAANVAPVLAIEAMAVGIAQAGADQR